MMMAHVPLLGCVGLEEALQERLGPSVPRTVLVHVLADQVGSVVGEHDLRLDQGEQFHAALHLPVVQLLLAPPIDVLGPKHAVGRLSASNEERGL